MRRLRAAECQGEVTEGEGCREGDGSFECDRLGLDEGVRSLRDLEESDGLVGDAEAEFSEFVGEGGEVGKFLADGSEGMFAVLDGDVREEGIGVADFEGPRGFFHGVERGRVQSEGAVFARKTVVALGVVVWVGRGGVRACGASGF